MGECYYNYDYDYDYGYAAENAGPETRIVAGQRRKR